MTESKKTTVQYVHETFPLHHFGVYREVPSRLRNGYMLQRLLGVRCPACDVEGPAFNHGRQRRCACGATLAVQGNALFVWKDLDVQS